MKIWKTMITLLIAALLVGCPASTGNDTHTVTFDSNSGSAVTSQQVAQGASVTEPEAPTRSGHAFDGWYSDIDLSNAWTFGSDTVDSDITLYAKWVIAHTVTFDSNSGSAVTSQQVAEGASADEPAAPTRSGYAFGGWYSDIDLANAWTFGSDAVDSDITLYAKWASKIPKMIFVQGGTFQMGSDTSDAHSSEGPVHSVTLSSFRMAETEVTHSQYLEFLNGAGVSAVGQLNGNEVIDMDDDSNVAFSHDGTGFSFAASEYAESIDCPVMEITWYGAVEYSNWLSGQDGLTTAYSISGTSVTWDQSADGYRLPTEAEWEYAARGGKPVGGVYVCWE